MWVEYVPGLKYQRVQPNVFNIVFGTININQLALKASLPSDMILFILHGLYDIDPLLKALESHYQRIINAN